MKVRVAVQAAIPDRLLAHFPQDAEIVRIPEHPAESYDVDFWVLPFGAKAAKAMFPYLRGVKVAQAISAGVDALRQWMPPEITLCDARGVHDISTSEWVLTVLLATYKRLPFYRDLQTQSVWKGQSHEVLFSDDDAKSNGIYRILGDDLHGRRIMIVGYGSIGAAIERRLEPFGIEVIRVARTAKSEPEVHSVDALHRLLPQADAVVLITPLTDQTRGMIGEKELSLMPHGALLVNAARGPVVHTEALLKELQAHRLRAALDVTDPEPLPAEHPLWKAPNLLLTPHIAGSSPGFMERVLALAAEQVERFAKGEPVQNTVGSSGY